MEITLSPVLPNKLISTAAVSCPVEDLQATCRPAILLHDSPKKSYEKSEKTVYIPTSSVLVNTAVSDLNQQQLRQQQHQPQQPTIFTSGGGKPCSSRIHISRTECRSAVTESVSSSEKDFHVVKIQISPNSQDGNSDRNNSFAINNNTSTISVCNENKINASIVDDQLVDKSTSALGDEQKNIKVSRCDKRSSTVLIGADFPVNRVNTEDSDLATKSDLTSDLSAVQRPVETPKVSIVSFISDDHKSLSADSDHGVVDDQCKLSVKSVGNKKNISQTFLNNSGENSSRSTEDSGIASLISTTNQTVSANTSFCEIDIQDSFLESDSIAAVRSPISLASTSVRSVLGTSTQQVREEISVKSLEQLPSAAAAVAPSSVQEVAVSVSSEEAELLNARVIADKSDTLAATITSNEMVQKPSGDLEVSNPTYLYYMMTSGQCSPSDTLDSGTCSDMENGGSNNNSASESVTPPPLPKKMGPKLKMMHLKTGTIIPAESTSDEPQNAANGNGNGRSHTRTGSFTDSEESECSLSCDSLNSSEFARAALSIPMPPPPPKLSAQDTIVAAISMLPDSLLRDIRDRKFASIKEDSIEVLTEKLTNELKLVEQEDRDRKKSCVLTSQDNNDTNTKNTSYKFETDKFYKFHINEKDMATDLAGPQSKLFKDDETFAGYKDIHSGSSTIRSSKGTVRGVKNRVRNGIATFLQMQQTNVKSYKEKDAGKVVLYTTSMGIIRETYAKCANVKQILRTLLIKFEERDVFMSCDYQQEIKDRMQLDEIQVPQLFVDGHHIGDAATVERLNESGELRQMLKPYKSMTSSYTCQVCGGYRLLPCSACNGSKKSVHRNHFTAEFVALKCMNCDEVGLVKCHNC